tara:strand:+ start:2221 stop:2529 length:309 start_codon:yes stop_codon:yes gene_type:complete
LLRRKDALKTDFSIKYDNKKSNGNVERRKTSQTMSTYILIALFCVWIPCGLLSTAIADSKNHPSWLWLLAGSVFGPIGLAGAVSLKDKDRISRNDAAQSTQR